MTKLGIGMPTYNSEKTIKKTINSVLNSTFSDFVLHIFDNCSSDKTCDIVKEFMEKDNRIILHKNSINIGLHPNFNKCLSLYNYEYIAIMSSNDIVYSKYYEECINFLDKHIDYALCYTEGTNTINRLLSYEHDDPLQRSIQLIETFSFGNMNYGVFRRSFLDKTLNYKPICMADHVFMFNIALIGKLGKINNILFERNIPNRSKKQYRELCHSSIKSTLEPNIPITRFTESLLGHIDVCNNAYLNNLNRELLIKHVILSILHRWGKNIIKELIRLKWYLFFHRFSLKQIDYFELLIFIKRAEFYIKKISIIELYRYNKQHRKISK